jgi:hypothetical protein
MRMLGTYVSAHESEHTTMVLVGKLTKDPSPFP